MSALPATILDTAGESLGSGLPRIGAALVLLVVGLVVARLARRVVVRAARAAGLDALAERVGVGEALERAGLSRSAATVLGTVVRLVIVAMVVFAAISMLGLEVLSASLNEALLFLPKLVLALALVLAGVVIGGFARDRTDRLSRQLDLPVPAGQVVQIVVVGVFAVTALALVGVPTVILTLLLAIALGSAGLALALAFGMGNRELARALGAGRLVRGSFAVGQTIAVGDVRGEIVEIQPASVTLRRPDGATVRVPNQLLLDGPVEIRPAEG